MPPREAQVWQSAIDPDIAATGETRTDAGTAAEVEQPLAVGERQRLPDLCHGAPIARDARVVKEPNAPNQASQHLRDNPLFPSCSQLNHRCSRMT